MTDRDYLNNAKCENMIGWSLKEKPHALVDSEIRVINWLQVPHVFLKFSRGHDQSTRAESAIFGFHNYLKLFRKYFEIYVEVTFHRVLSGLKNREF